jgi:CRISPR-associated endonuclease Cas1
VNLKNRLNIYTSFLHEADNPKPSLVFDLIEEFRQFVVDKEIISIINRNIKLTSNKRLLTEKSKKIVLQHIQERLVHLVNWKKGRYKVISIIENQARALSKAINYDEKYKGFIGRF